MCLFCCCYSSFTTFLFRINSREFLSFFLLFFLLWWSLLSFHFITSNLFDLLWSQQSDNSINSDSLLYFFFYSSSLSLLPLLPSPIHLLLVQVFFFTFLNSKKTKKKKLLPPPVELLSMWCDCFILCSFHSYWTLHIFLPSSSIGHKTVEPKTNLSTPDLVLDCIGGLNTLSNVIHSLKIIINFFFFFLLERVCLMKNKIK